MSTYPKSLNILADSIEEKVGWALSALEEIGRYLTQRARRFNLKGDERTQIISALAYARSQRRGGSCDAEQQYRDWVDAEFDLDLILTHLRALHPDP